MERALSLWCLRNISYKPFLPTTFFFFCEVRYFSVALGLARLTRGCDGNQEIIQPHRHIPVAISVSIRVDSVLFM